MAVINGDNAEAWRQIATDASRDRPSVGRRVKVTGGRKHLNREGVVKKHIKSKFDNAFRYGGEANLQLREMLGKAGFVCLVRDDAGEEFWVSARHVTCVDQVTQQES